MSLFRRPSDSLSVPATDIPEDVREQVYARDRYRCRWCGRTNGAVHLHHIDYRSAGGRHLPENLITLCVRHHQLVHTDKGFYPPLLTELVRRGGVTGIELARWARRREVVAVDFIRRRRIGA